MGQAQINVRTRACSRTSIARTKQAALTHNVRGKELKLFPHSLGIAYRGSSLVCYSVTYLEYKSLCHVSATDSFVLCCINIINYNKLTFDTREH